MDGRGTLMIFLVFLACLCHVLSEVAIRFDPPPYDNFLTYSVHWSCNSNAECTATNSTCIDKRCQCTAGYIYNVDMTSCVKVATAYGEECQETIQCSTYLLSGAKCIENSCVCDHGYYYLHGRCNPYVGLFQSCQRDVDCYVNSDFEASSCIDGKCKCSPGFYQREYRSCRRAGEKIGDECTVDIDCIFHENAICMGFKCAVQNNKNDTTAVRAKRTQITQESNAGETMAYIGSNCTNNSECSTIASAICGPSNTCICKRAHFVPKKKIDCYAELGESCQSTDSNGIKSSICRERKWSCTGGTVGSKNNQICRKTTKQYGSSCLHDEQCYIFGPDAGCENKKCVCKNGAHFVESELFCWISRGIDETCESNNDCYMEGLESKLYCKNQKCSCPHGTHLNAKKTKCIKSVAEIGMACEMDIDCVTENSRCNNKTCTCIENYYVKDGNCVKGINSTCSTHSDCIPENSICSNSTCTCMENYVAPTAATCAFILFYGNPCEYDIQCFTRVPNSLCLESKTISKSSNQSNDKTCTCMEGYHYNSEECHPKRVLGESCTNPNQCYLSRNKEMTMCMNDKCTCVWGFERANDTLCVPSNNRRYFLYGSATRPSTTWLVAIIFILFFNLI